VPRSSGQGSPIAPQWAFILRKPGKPGQFRKPIGSAPRHSLRHSKSITPPRDSRRNKRSDRMRKGPSRAHCAIAWTPRRAAALASPYRCRALARLPLCAGRRRPGRSVEPRKRGRKRNVEPVELGKRLWQEEFWILMQLGRVRPRGPFGMSFDNISRARLGHLQAYAPKHQFQEAGPSR